MRPVESSSASRMCEGAGTSGSPRASARAGADAPVMARTMNELSTSAQTTPAARMNAPTSTSASIELRMGLSISAAGSPIATDHPVSGDRLIDAYAGVPSSIVERQLPSRMRAAACWKSLLGTLPTN